MKAGEAIGAYRILDRLGEGGMGEVYRATDTTLGREVAIKVLPEAFAHDPDRLARFEREAKTLAALNHPNIAHIYGLEHGSPDAGHHVRALVMELVEGPTLAEILTGSGLSAIGPSQTPRPSESPEPRAQSQEPKALERFPSTRRCRSRDRSRKLLKPRMSGASSTAISSPPTSRCGPMAR